MGDLTLVRQLALAGIRCALIARSDHPGHASRFVCASLDPGDVWAEPELAVDRLVSFGRTFPERPVLFYEGDGDLLLVSRYRDRLSAAFRFVVADPVLVEDLVDKGRFQALAQRLDLPVPRSRRLSYVDGAWPDVGDLRFPVILKQLVRRADDRFRPPAGGAKGLHVDTPAQLAAVCRQLAQAGIEVLAQEVVPGPETRVESFHVYVDDSGTIAGEFTGRKIRTYPIHYGDSSAVEIVDLPDVRALGREFTRRLGLRGVAKFDFKRGPDGRLHLLEVNPRFNLWHHPAALAGINLPALVYADLVGQPRLDVAPTQRRIRWCDLRLDVRAARASGIPLVAWLLWALSSEAKGGGIAWDDPLPAVYVVRSLVARARATPRALQRHQRA
jgi:predicted ATP-grasp superfamily ATP-dependent carboligase